MSTFDFKLEPLLKLRKMRQEQSERELARRLSQLLLHRRNVENLERQIVDYYRQIRLQRSTGEIQITGLIADRRYLNHLHQLRHHETTTLAQHQPRVDQARRQLAEAKKQTDILLKLEERMRLRFTREQFRRETIERDDLTAANLAWRSATTGASE